MKYVFLMYELVFFKKGTYNELYEKTQINDMKGVSMAEPEKKHSSNNHHFKLNQDYLTICFYILAMIIAACIIVRLFYHWDNTLKFITTFLSKLSSFAFGILIAFMVNPLVKYIQRTILEKGLKLKNKKLIQILSILLAYIIVFGFLIICLVYVIPQLITSITDLSNSLPSMYYSFVRWLRNFANSNEFLSNDFVNDIINTISPKIVELSTTIASRFIPWLYSASVAVVSWFVTFFIALMVSIYLLFDKKIIFRSIKRIFYAFLPTERVPRAIEILRNCNDIFSGYIIGKAIDSLIIGILCAIIMAIFNLPYTVLISVVVGITNMIPYFGPYIGAVPGLVILSVTNLRYGFIFLILIIALQQFDGLILGPRILGNSTGLRPILILFAITFGGAYAGILGMFLGVPFVAVLQYLFGLIVDKRLRQKNIDNL